MNSKVFLILLFVSCIALNVNGQETVIFQDNFNDGSIADWDVNSGIWSAATFALVGPGSDNQSISHVVSMPADGRSKRVFFRMQISAAPVEGEFGFMTDHNGMYNAAGNTNFSGYVIRMTNANINLVRKINGSGSTLLSVANPSGAGVYVDINVGIGFDGNLSLWVNGVPQSSVIDTTFLAGTKIVYGTNQGPTISVEDLNILYTGDSNVNFRIVDEESGVGISNPTMTINGAAWPTNSNGTFDVNSSISFPATVTVSKAGYDGRTFLFDTNAGMHQLRLWGLRTAAEASDIGFIFYAPDEATKISEQYIAVVRGTTILSGRGKTNTNGNLTFNLAPQDSNYSIRIFTSPTDTSIQYTYTTVAVTVTQAKNEVTNALITPNLFDLDVGGLGLQTYDANALPISTIVILGNTEDVYTLQVVDSNSNGQQYYARNYIMQAKGDQSTLTINPFLIPIADGILVNLKVANLVDNQTVPNIRIQMFAGVNGVRTVMEDRVTDAAGIAQMVMLPQKVYELLITSAAQDINYFNGLQPLSASSQNFTLWIQYTQVGITVTQKNTRITIAPSTTILSVSPQRIDVNIDTNVNFTTIYVQAFDGNVLVDQNNCATASCHVALTLNLNNLDSNFLNVRMVIQNGDVNIYVKNVNYIIAGFTSEIVSRAQGLKYQLGPVQLGLIMFLVIFLVISMLGSSPLGNNMSQIFIIVLVAGAFYFMWFLETELFMPFVAGVFGVILIYFWSRQKGGP